MMTLRLLKATQSFARCCARRSVCAHTSASWVHRSAPSSTACRCSSSASQAEQAVQMINKFKPQVNFCRQCGSPMHQVQPEGDKELRAVCSSCSYVDYINPKMVVGCIVEHDSQILLCKRAIEPCKGKWTLPAGFLEWHESTAAGAARETFEEANATVQVLAPYFHLDIPVLGQTYILFRSRLLPPFSFSPGSESLETQLFSPADIPFDQLAFSSVAITLQQYLADLQVGVFPVHHGVIDKQPGAAPSDIYAYVLRDHMVVGS